MKDTQILTVWRSSPDEGLELARQHYGKYIRKIAFSVLHNEQDAEEVENDVLLGLWQHLQSEDIESLKGFLGKLSREEAIDRLRRKAAARRGQGQQEAAWEELADCFPGEESDPLEAWAVRKAWDAFLRGLPEKKRKLFLCRYWYGLSVKECAEAFHMKEGAVKTALLRCRETFREFLKREEIEV